MESVCAFDGGRIEMEGGRGREGKKEKGYIDVGFC